MKKFIKSLNKNDIIFKKPKYGIEQKYKIGKINILLKVYKDFKEIINQKNSTIFAVIDGRVVDKKIEIFFQLEIL